MDQFAQIAANGIGGNAALLEPVTPIPHETVICRLEQAGAQPIAVKPHLSTTEELKTELAAMREAYRPFLEITRLRLKACAGAWISRRFCAMVNRSRSRNTAGRSACAKDI